MSDSNSLLEAGTSIPSVHMQMPVLVVDQEQPSPAVLHMGTSLMRFQGVLQFFFLFYPSLGYFKLRRNQTICASEPWRKTVLLGVSTSWLPGGHHGSLAHRTFFLKVPVATVQGVGFFGQLS